MPVCSSCSSAATIGTEVASVCTDCGVVAAAGVSISTTTLVMMGVALVAVAVLHRLLSRSASALIGRIPVRILGRSVRPALG